MNDSSMLEKKIINRILNWSSYWILNCPVYIGVNQRKCFFFFFFPSLSPLLLWNLQGPWRHKLKILILFFFFFFLLSLENWFVNWSVSVFYITSIIPWQAVIISTFRRVAVTIVIIFIAFWFMPLEWYIFWIKFHL